MCANIGLYKVNIKRCEVAYCYEDDQKLEMVFTKTNKGSIRQTAYIKSYHFIELYDAEEVIVEFLANNMMTNPPSLVLKDFLGEYKTQIGRMEKGDYHSITLTLSKTVKLNGFDARFELSEKSMELILNDIKSAYKLVPDEGQTEPKTGRGTKINDAYRAVPREAVRLDEFLRIHDVGENIMKQHKRFDNFKERGKVRTRTVSGVKMIWRDQPDDEDDLGIW